MFNFDVIGTVQMGRLELPSLAALVPDTSVSTNSTTPAYKPNPDQHADKELPSAKFLKTQQLKLPKPRLEIRPLEIIYG